MWSRLRFNSRARRGRDMDLTDVLPNVDVSIHAPVGGATHYILGGVNGGVVSIHAPVGGATIPRLSLSSRGAGFNSRARRGRDQ